MRPIVQLQAQDAVPVAVKRDDPRFFLLPILYQVALTYRITLSILPRRFRVATAPYPMVLIAFLGPALLSLSLSYYHS
ncbi:MAG: hypothetical protein J3Q66DRAFT_347398 [Benniella sp.]|nr:MAG: hypothetical protein J3Q66DRAFT_347398 [Benniella sp.]